LRYFDRIRNCLSIDENPKIVVKNDRKSTKERIINHKGTKMVKDGED